MSIRLGIISGHLAPRHPPKAAPDPAGGAQDPKPADDDARIPGGFLTYRQVRDLGWVPVAPGDPMEVAGLAPGFGPRDLSKQIW